MFGRKKTATPTTARLSPVPVAEPHLDLSDEDRERMTDLAHEIADSLMCTDGTLLLDDAVEVNVCTMPAPILELVYPSYTVEMHMEIYHYDDEEVTP